MLEDIKIAAGMFVIGLTSPMFAFLVMGSLVLIGSVGLVIYLMFCMARGVVRWMIKMWRAANADAIDKAWDKVEAEVEAETKTKSFTVAA